MDEIERKSKHILDVAVQRYVSDIHFIARKKEMTVYFRINNHMVFQETIKKAQSEKIISHFKFISGMDIGEKRRPQNAAMEYRFRNKLIHLRLSILPTPFQESLVIRLLPQDETFSLEELSLFPKVISIFYSLIKRSNGLIILTGPTGAGKTSTLYALLYAMKERQMKNIITLEDPIEKRTDDFIQMEINEKAGLTYAEGLKAMLRHDPDIIMIGEIRDEQTARLAIRASLTGHLVLTTMHTNNAAGAISRLVELGVPLCDIEQTLIGVSAQRLVEKNCVFCGNNCNRQCRMFSNSRMSAIFELLTGDKLDKAIKNLGSAEQKQNQLVLNIRMAYALGFITKESLERWGGELFEE